MTMTILWTGMVVLSILCGLATGQSAQVAAAAVEGTQAAVELCLSIAGMLCLWTGVGNAATPLGLEAARRMSRCSPGVASDALCMLVVCNTASIQLIPTTVATVRAGAGSAAPFDILPAVWLASGLSVGVGVLACKICARIWRD